MTSEEAGRLQELWKAQNGEKTCTHNRVVDYLISNTELNTGSLVCRECGAVFPDPLKKLG